MIRLGIDLEALDMRGGTDKSRPISVFPDFQVITFSPRFVIARLAKVIYLAQNRSDLKYSNLRPCENVGALSMKFQFLLPCFQASPPSAKATSRPLSRHLADTYGLMGG